MTVLPGADDSVPGMARARTGRARALTQQCGTPAAGSRPVFRNAPAAKPRNGDTVPYQTLSPRTDWPRVQQDTTTRLPFSAIRPTALNLVDGPDRSTSPATLVR